MRHMADAAVAAEEEECRALLEELWRECTPEAKAEHAKHDHILFQDLVRCKTWSGPEQDSDVHEDWSVQQTTRST